MFGLRVSVARTATVKLPRDGFRRPSKRISDTAEPIYDSS